MDPMQYVTTLPSAVRALAEDRVSVAFFALIWLSVPVVIAIASLVENPEGNPVYYVTIGLLIAFRWRARVAMQRAGIDVRRATVISYLILALICGTLIAAAWVGWITWWIAHV
jgi:hypothetical protein